jgi:predicted amidophosphoribosyltransferase
MSYDLTFSKLEFGSLLSYSTHGSSEPERDAREVMLLIKGDKYFQDPPILMSRFITDLIIKDATLPFAHFFDTETILVPVPNSSLMKDHSLWVPHRIASALHDRGFGIGVAEMLRRKIPLQKAATSLPENRPKAAQHCQSLEVQDILMVPKQILLIDDIVTRGATLLGAANKLKKAYPNVTIRAFCAMRAISHTEDFQDVYDPCFGHITLIGDETYRNP